MTKTLTKYAAAAVLAVVTGIYASPTLAQTVRHRAHSETIQVAPGFTGEVFDAAPGSGMGPGSAQNDPFYRYPDSYEGPNRSLQEHVTGD